MTTQRFTTWVGMVCAIVAMNAGCDGASRLGVQTGGSAALYGQFRAFDGHTGRPISFDALVERTGNTDVVLFGEQHSDVICNALEAQLLSAMAERGRPVSLAMEFFENDTQGPLDAYLAGRIEEADFRKLARQRKPYLLAHRPLIEYCRANCIPIIAANAPTRLTRALRVSGKTFDEFCATTQPADRAMLPARSELLEGAYFERFKEAMSGHEMPTSQPASQPTSAPASNEPSKEEKLLRSYRAQSMWDDSMSEAVAIHRARHPDRRVMLVVGCFHVEKDGGTQVKLRERRPNDRVMTIVYRGIPSPPLRFDEEDRGAGDIILYGISPPDEESMPSTPTSQPTTAPTSQPAPSPVASATPPSIPNVRMESPIIITQELRLVDSEGKILAILGSRPGGGSDLKAGLYLFGHDSGLRGSFSVQDDRPTLDLRDQNENFRLSMYVTKHRQRAGIVLNDPEGNQLSIGSRISYESGDGPVTSILATNNSNQVLWKLPVDDRDGEDE